MKELESKNNIPQPKLCVKFGKQNIWGGSNNVDHAIYVIVFYNKFFDKYSIVLKLKITKKNNRDKMEYINRIPLNIPTIKSTKNLKSHMLNGLHPSKGIQ